MIDLKPFYQSYTRAAVKAASPRDRESVAWAYVRLAMYELQRGNLPDAQRMTDAALQYVPDYAAALLVRGRIQLAQKRTADAVETLTRAERLNPLPEYQWALADALRLVNHTLASLALAVIGGVHAPAWIVEPLIAASSAWVGLENLLQRRSCVRWGVVFGVGLIHGFGFAGALMELGFGSSPAEMALALISFNLGVQAGQLAVAAAMLPLVWMIRSRALWQARLLPVCSVLIVIAAGYWLIERLH